ncbi:flippase [Piscibacillus salipiscarius]|uniref:Flippase n=2 Tax=Piscibacillus salipiscarius TaxID=299480 RepID=A0ABW5QB33_9BACI
MSKEIKNVTKQSGIVFIGKVLGLVLGLIFNVLAARYLGAELFGKFTYIFTFISFFPIIALLGIQQGIVYYIPKLDEEKNYKFKSEIITISFLIVSLIGVILSFVLILNSDFILNTVLNSKEEAYNSIYYLVVPLIVFLALSQLAQGVFRGVKHIKPFVINQDFIVPLLKILVLVISIIFLGNQIETIILSFYVSIIIGCLYLINAIRKKDLFGKISLESMKNYKQVLLYSFPLLFTGFLGFISQKTDVFMIGYLLNDQDVGVYRIALQIGTLSSFTLVAFNMIFAPTISSLFHKGNIKELELMFKTITKWVVTVNLLAFGLILLLNEEIMLVFGYEFLFGSTALVLVAIGQVVNAGVGSAGQFLTMTGHPFLTMIINFMTVILNIFLNLTFIPKFGIEGAALASLMSVAFANILKLILLYSIHRIQPYDRYFLKMLLSVSLSFIVIYFLKLFIDFHFIISILILAIAYIMIFLILYYFVGMNNEDKRILNEINKYIKLKLK